MMELNNKQYCTDDRAECLKDILFSATRFVNVELTGYVADRLKMIDGAARCD